MLNQDQFDSLKAGDWYCLTCPTNGRDARGMFCYFWSSELETINKQQSDTIMRT